RRAGSGCGAFASCPTRGPGPCGHSPSPPGTSRWAVARPPCPAPRLRLPCSCFFVFAFHRRLGRTPNVRSVLRCRRCSEHDDSRDLDFAVTDKSESTPESVSRIRRLHARDREVAVVDGALGRSRTRPSARTVGPCPEHGFYREPGFFECVSQSMTLILRVVDG